MHKLNILKHLSAIQNFSRRESNSQSPTLSSSFSPTLPLTWGARRAAPQHTQAGAGGVGEKSASNKQQVVQKQQLVDKMCSLDLRRLHRRRKVSCHKTLNLLLCCRQNGTFLAKAWRVPTDGASADCESVFANGKGDYFTVQSERAISHVSRRSFSEMTKLSGRWVPPRTRCTAPLWQAHPSAQHVQVPIKCRRSSIKWRRRGVTP